jgi:hypothetical protein
MTAAFTAVMATTQAMSAGVGGTAGEGAVGVGVGAAVVGGWGAAVSVGMGAWSVIRRRAATERAYTRRNPAREARALTSRPALFAILALPAAVIGYAVTVTVLSGLPIPDGLRAVVLTLVPLFVAGLCMVPFVLPWFDQMAKRDLAAYRASQTSEPAETEDAKPD